MEPERAQAVECETRSQELGWELEEGGISEATQSRQAMCVHPKSAGVIDKYVSLCSVVFNIQNWQFGCLWGKGAMIVGLLIIHVI